MNNPTPQATHKQIGLWLKRKRGEAGYTQAQLAMKIGRSKSFVWAYEQSGKVEIEQFVRIAEALNANPHELIQTLYLGDRRN
jgi:transcriptional regulator with XRE-family HTH domain